MSNSEADELIGRFLSGEDTTLEAANRLEVLLDDEHPDDDFLQETVEALACYRPEGGELLMGVKDIQKRLQDTRRYMMEKGLLISP